MKQRYVVREARGGVPLRIEGDEQRLDGFAGGTQSIHGQPDLHQVGRADVWAIGVAEIDQQQLATKIRVRARLPGVVDQSERPADRAAVPHQIIH